MDLPKEVIDAIEIVKNACGKQAVIEEANNTFSTTKEGRIIKQYSKGNFRNILEYLNSME